LPSIYYLPADMECKTRISIAASADPIRKLEPFEEQATAIKAAFQKYSLITVRDEPTQALVNRIGGKSCHIVADPTILYDFEQDIKLGASENPTVGGPARIGIVVRSKAFAALLKDHLSAVGNTALFTHTLPRRTPYIEAELSRLKEQDVIITDFFHKSIFALKLSKALVINVELASRNPLPNSKGRSLFTAIGLEEYFLRHEEASAETTMARIAELIETWNQSRWHERTIKLHQYIERSKTEWYDILAKIKL
jgi:hypothetical protein